MNCTKKVKENSNSLERRKEGRKEGSKEGKNKGMNEESRGNQKEAKGGNQGK